MSGFSVISENGADIIKYIPESVCSKFMQLRIKNDIIEDIEILGGCSGNLSGISNLIRGMNINDVVEKLQGIPCGNKPTSCPDQLSKALAAYIEEKQQVKA